MANLKHLTARALARAMFAGPATAAGLAGRLQACLGTPAAWCPPFAERCARWPAERWWRLAPRALARLIELDPGYQASWRSDQPLSG